MMLPFASWAADNESVGGTPILNAGSFWRYHLTMRDVALGTARDAKPAEPNRFGHRFNTALPPMNWMQPDFDDSGWGRERGPFYPGYGFHQDRALALLCLRGKFAVSDLSGAQDLVFSATFRGGLVAYLNGKEVVRAALPPGDITFETLAHDYPWETYVKPDGKVIRWGWGDPQNFKDRCELRLRQVANVVIPAKLLHPGTNVLAIEIHRAAVHKDTLNLQNAHVGHWNSVGLPEVALSAPGTGATRPNVERPKGLQVWNANPLAAVFESDYGDPNEKLQPLCLMGARGGTFSAQVMVSADAPVTGVEAEVRDLRLKDARSSIPASAIQVRYAHPGRTDPRSARHFDTLSHLPPAADQAAQVQPIWLTVSVPRDAQAGEYEGSLLIQFEEMDCDDIVVPVLLTVADWTLPDPRDFVTFVDFVESPESVALRYQVSLWSKEHFTLIGKTFAHLARLGNKTIYIPLICKTNFGNDQTMVRWLKKDDGSYNHDFSVLEKYLDLYLEQVGKPSAVIFQVWDHFAGGGYFGAKSGRQPLNIPVSLWDPETGQVSVLEGPRYHEPQAESFWRPVTKGIHRRLVKRGLEKVLMIGTASDVMPSKQVVELWHKLWPEARWVHQGHGLRSAFHGVPVGYNTTVWKPQWAYDPDVKRTYGWRNPELVAHFDRDIWKPSYDVQLLSSRLIGEKNIQGKQRGFGRMSADFWPVLKDRDGNITRSISARHLISNWNQLNLRMIPYLAPGPAGAMPTVRFEMMRESLQECEARILLEKALIDATKRAKLGEELAEKCQALLDERTRAIICRSGNRRQLGNQWYVASGWQERSQKLYDAAAELAQKLEP